VKSPFSIFFQKKDDKEPLEKEELITQRARVSGSYYQEKYSKKPTLSDIYEMRQDPTIKIGLSVIKHPLQRVDWEVIERDTNKKLPPEIKHFIE